MRPEDIRIGDTLRIRGWDDMVSEFGTDADGDMAIKNKFGDIYCYFLKHMKHLCGKQFNVKEISDGGSFFYTDDPALDGWTIVAEMLEPFSPELPELASREESLNQILFS